MAGRIETYIHSDKSVPNKAGAMIRVACQTDFAARTDEFAAFAKSAAKMAFASSAETWADVVSTFPQIELDREELSKAVKEKIEIDQIVIMSV